MRLLAGLFLALSAAMPVGAALLRVWVNQDAVQSGYELSNEAKERRELRETARKLEVELAAERSPERLRRLAQQLGLTPPTPSQIVDVGGADER